jgi:hypothetical protein
MTSAVARAYREYGAQPQPQTPRFEIFTVTLSSGAQYKVNFYDEDLIFANLKMFTFADSARKCSNKVLLRRLTLLLLM